jgi:hypothetical protein
MKPSDFFIGAMDFFAILLPGAVLAFLLKPWADRLFGPAVPALDDSAQRWVAFAVCAYIFGHLLHAAGSVLDDFYDKSYAKPRRERDGDTLLDMTKKRVKDQFKDTDKFDSDGFNYFQWAGSCVRAGNAAAAAELERAGGDSKFFRSLCLLAALAALLALARLQLFVAALWLLLMVFSYRRFCSRRWQASQQTYEYFLVLQIAAPTVPDQPPADPTTQPAQPSA